SPGGQDATTESLHASAARAEKILSWRRGGPGDSISARGAHSPSHRDRLHVAAASTTVAAEWESPGGQDATTEPIHASAARAEKILSWRRGGPGDSISARGAHSPSQRDRLHVAAASTTVRELRAARV